MANRTTGKTKRVRRKRRPPPDKSLGVGILGLKREFRGLGSFDDGNRDVARRSRASLLEHALLVILQQLSDSYDEPSPLRIPVSVVAEWIALLIAENRGWGFVDHDLPYPGRRPPDSTLVLAKLRPSLRELARTARWDLEDDHLVLRDWDRLVGHWRAVAEARQDEKARRYVSARRRAEVMAWDGPWCKWCGRETNLTIDHIVPVRAGGDSSLLNLRVMCRSCNSMRNNDRPYSLTMHQLMWYFGIDRDRLAEVLAILSNEPSLAWNDYSEIALTRRAHGKEVESLHQTVQAWMSSHPVGELSVAMKKSSRVATSRSPRMATEKSSRVAR